MNGHSTQDEDTTINCIFDMSDEQFKAEKSEEIMLFIAALTVKYLGINLATCVGLSILQNAGGRNKRGLQ